MADNNLKIIFINGPPRSGKDTLANKMMAQYHLMNIEKYMVIHNFKEPLVEAVSGLFGLHPITWEIHYEDLKDEPWDALHGLSQRQALIWMSETVAKGKFGRDFFGKSMITRLEDEFADIVIIPDSGFLEETQTVVDKFGKKNCIMINTIREGTDFSKDSRDWVTGDMLGIKGMEFRNNRTLKDLKDKVPTFTNMVLEELYAS